MSDTQALLDQIDRLDGELLPDWRHSDRTGAVIANAYRKQGDKWSCLVAKDIPADCDGEFIALSRTALPALSRAVRAALELHKPRSHEETPCDLFCNVCGNYAPCETFTAITDAMEGDDD